MTWQNNLQICRDPFRPEERQAGYRGTRLNVNFETGPNASQDELKCQISDHADLYRTGHYAQEVE